MHAITKHMSRLATAGLVAAAALAAAPGAQAAVHPNTPSLCGWHPANDSHAPGFSGTASIYSVQGGRCGATQALWGDYVVVHCYAYSGGTEWFYLYDAADGVTGWMTANSVSGVYPGAC
jgi:hypothetical protein